MKVRITGGTYGWRDEKRRVTRMHAGDTCEVSETEGARLCSLGIAEPAEGETVKATAQAAEPAAGKTGQERTKASPVTEEAAETDEPPDRDVLARMTVAQLRKLCVAEGMDEAEAKKFTKADCIDYLAPIPETIGGEVGDIIV